MSGEAATAAAVTSTRTSMSPGWVSPGASTWELAHWKLAAPAPPVQVQPVPAGVAASTTPTGRRSSTVYAPTVAALPALRTRTV